MKKILSILLFLPFTTFAYNDAYNYLDNKAEWTYKGYTYTRPLGQIKIDDNDVNVYTFAFTGTNAGGIKKSISDFLTVSNVATVNNDSSKVGIGRLSSTTGGGSIGIGSSATSAGNGTIGLGANATALGFQNMALGVNSLAIGRLSASIGAYSYADEENVISFGNENLKRKLINVADGEKETDAINKRQLDNEVKKINTKFTEIDEKFVGVNTEIKNVRQEAETNKQIQKEYVNVEINRIKETMRKNNEEIQEFSKQYTRETVAQAVAIAGLFQPVVEEKGNVSISIGGYNKDVALALGGGYKINEMFGVRAGLSTNFKTGVAWNAAVNFEF